MLQFLPYPHRRFLDRKALYLGNPWAPLPMLGGLVWNYNPTIRDIPNDLPIGRGVLETVIRDPNGEPVPVRLPKGLSPAKIERWREGFLGPDGWLAIGQGPGGVGRVPAPGPASDEPTIAMLGSYLALGPFRVSNATRLQTSTYGSLWADLAGLTAGDLSTAASHIYSALFAEGPTRDVDPTSGPNALWFSRAELVIGDVIMAQQHDGISRSAYVLKPNVEKLADRLDRNISLLHAIRAFRWITCQIRAAIDFRLAVIKHALSVIWTPESEVRIRALGHESRLAIAAQFRDEKTTGIMSSLLALTRERNGPTPWNANGAKRLVDADLVSALNSKFKGDLTLALLAAVKNLTPFFHSLRLLRSNETLAELTAAESLIGVGGPGPDLGDPTLPYFTDYKIVHTDGVRASLPKVSVADILSASWFKVAEPRGEGGFETTTMGPTVAFVTEGPDMGGPATPAGISKREPPTLWSRVAEYEIGTYLTGTAVPPESLRPWSEYQGGVPRQVFLPFAKDGTPLPCEKIIGDVLGTSPEGIMRMVAAGRFNHILSLRNAGDVAHAYPIKGADGRYIQTVYYTDVQKGVETVPLVTLQFSDDPQSDAKIRLLPLIAKGRAVIGLPGAPEDAQPGAVGIVSIMFDRLYADKTEPPIADVVMNLEPPVADYDMTVDLENLTQGLLGTVRTLGEALPPPLPPSAKQEG